MHAANAVGCMHPIFMDVIAYIFLQTAQLLNPQKLSYE
jgi:hypothetical protein